MKTIFRRAAALAACVPGLLLAACETQYSVDIRNTSPQPVFVEMIVRYPTGQVTVNQSARLGPGDRGTLGPVITNVDNLVSFRADTMANPQRPARLDLRPGNTRVEVGQVGEHTGGPVQVHEQP